MTLPQAMITAAFCASFVLLRVDWDLEVRVAQDRIVADESLPQEHQAVVKKPTEHSF